MGMKKLGPGNRNSLARGLRWGVPQSATGLTVNQEVVGSRPTSPAEITRWL